ncbi:MAG: hypothetical protein OEL83_01240 [Desulforhopalus sp.]|nr:hypothetical protein [Desulforhopalus sp.]
MTCEPKELFVFADWLFRTRCEPTESVLRRTIVNRLYYAALIAARDHTGSSTTGRDGHKAVVDALRGVSLHAASLLDAMRTNRNVNDYELTTPVEMRDVHRSLENARMIFYELGETFPLGPSYTKDFLDMTKFVSHTAG